MNKRQLIIFVAICGSLIWGGGLAAPSLAQPSESGEPRPTPIPGIDWANVQMAPHDPLAAPQTVPAPNSDTTFNQPASSAPNENAPSSSGSSYTVQVGDTLYDIARHFGVDMSAIVTANSITNPQLIYPGMILTIPNGAAQPQPQPQPVTPSGGNVYTVQQGDTLGNIARHFDLQVQALAAANGLSNPNLIFVGQVLQIPDGAVETAVPTPPPSTAAPTPEPAPEGSTTYTVQSGDSLYFIASRFGISLSALISANNITNPSLVYPGLQLIIPNPATVPDDNIDPAAGLLIWPTERRALYQYYRYGHEAIDVDVAAGSSIVASAAGTVEFSGWNNYGYGYLIVLDHGNGVRTLYAHNSELKVKTGDTVNQGDVISLSGSTGYSTVPHLHFEVFVNGRHVDPCKYLPDGCG
ncbi:MAG: LysM peptidoglycan-binding domain-containing protein [Anaerolineales bacterium]|nr:LysM peptidoglycan-binding domain-containing protein [Anaerolineales bacterium]MCB8990811.1 LysM peptidoglycan-binding domain-containing protein [Ardenticatenaceae bacterium]MCB9004495.1 LysM peptidoglycan-binding domain-containing protein [Ardenticatenaceae bacterium]